MGNPLSLADIDAARRIRDTVNLHLAAASDVMDVVRKWCAFRLDDGRSDNTVYDSKDDALQHTRYSKDHCYLQITPDGITVKDALAFLRVNRHPLIDTTAPEHVIGPQIFKRFSNLTPAQKEFLRRQAEREAKQR